VSASRSSPRSGVPPGRTIALATQTVLALALVGVAMVPPLVDHSEPTLQIHHLQHAVLIGLGGGYGLILGRGTGMQRRLIRPGSTVGYALVLAVFVAGPLVVMAAMFPATGSWTDAYPVLHGLEHLGFIVAGCLIALAGRAFSLSISTLGVLLTVAMAAGLGALTQPHAPTVPAAIATAIAQGSGSSGPAAGPGDAAAGLKDFTSLGCKGCHTLASVGATGTFGPSLNHVGKTRSLDWLMVQFVKPCAPGHQRPGYSCQVMVSVVAALSERQRKDLVAFLFAQK
jgi:hypothetical protein